MERPNILGHAWATRRQGYGVETGRGLCAHLTHTGRHEALDAFTVAFQRSSAQTAAIDHAPDNAHPRPRPARPAPTQPRCRRPGLVIAEEWTSDDNDWTVAEMCRTLEVSRSGFYDWQSRPRSDREVTDAVLTMETRLSDILRASSGALWRRPLVTVLRANRGSG